MNEALRRLDEIIDERMPMADGRKQSEFRLHPEFYAECLDAAFDQIAQHGGSMTFAGAAFDYRGVTFINELAVPF